MEKTYKEEEKWFWILPQNEYMGPLSIEQKLLKCIKEIFFIIRIIN